MDPANSVAVELIFENAKGRVELTVEEWQNWSIDVRFRDELYRNSGVVHFDGRTGNANIETARPYDGILADSGKLQEYLWGFVQLFAKPFTFGWSPPPAEVLRYDEDYHSSNRYTQGDPVEIEIKTVQAEIVKNLAAPKKCLIAGSSNGELVRRCRAIGIDAYGFDLIPNVKEIAFPEVRDYLRFGSLTSIPYAAADAFDTLVAVDVLEHIPERDIPAMVDQWLALDIRKLVLLINLNQFWYPGHITLRPLWWWGERWGQHFRNLVVKSRFPQLPAVYSNARLYNQQWTYWERL